MNKLLLFLSCVIAVVSDISYVWYSKNNEHSLTALVIGIIGSIISVSIWVYTMKHGIESTMAITVYALLTVAGCSCLGYFIFHEPLSLQNKIGLLLAMAALLLISN